ncbi:branched-chain amino acid ABC transporter permease [Schinkia azotoformans]|uniref:branched-chain amino acid ABC transporter permease n=1 Tax=Schinkia azotoformans TaxID=1454 RepID=UPI002E1DCB63|nr:branched-chain amino acid ABC transporter permease [Schinkia azotoformans]
MSKYKIIVLCVLFLAIPWVSNNYLLALINLCAIATIGAHGLNILTGYTGLISLGHAAFIGVGAYTAAVFSTQFNVPWFLSILIAGIVTALIGLIFGLPSLRLRGMYLAMATLAASVILIFIFEQWKSVTGGVSGFYISSPTVFGISLGDYKYFYYLSVGMAVLATIGVKLLFASRTGRAFIAIRDRDLAAEIVGINAFHYKLYSFAISSFYAGIAGALLGFYLTFATPESFTLAETIKYIAMIIIGGLGTLSGPIVGAVFVTLFPDVLSIIIAPIQHLMPDYGPSALRNIIFGGLIIFFLVYEPKGLVSLFQRMALFAKKFKEKKPATVASQKKVSIENINE